VLPRLAYLALCRSIQRLVLLAHSEAARTWRSWCSATSSPCSAGDLTPPKLEPADRALLAAVSRVKGAQTRT
jgi:hypothetical protein